MAIRDPEIEGQAGLAVVQGATAPPLRRFGPPAILV